MTPSGAPFGGFCPRLRSLCKDRKGGVLRRFPEWPVPFDNRRARLGAPWKVSPPPGLSPCRRTMPTHPPMPIPLCAAQARPARRSGHETTGSVRHPAISPVSPEGDHFPQARCMRLRVIPSRPAPTPPRRNALRCIRGRDGRIVGMAGDGGEIGAGFCREIRGCEGFTSPDEGRRGRSGR